MSKITIGDYLLMRLSELGISDIFGVPGDYNLGFLDQVSNYPKIKLKVMGSSLFVLRHLVC